MEEEANTPKEQPKEDLKPNISSQTIKDLDESNEMKNLKKIEAAFFLSARYLSLNELVLLTDINPLMIRELIEKLYEKYNTEESAIEIITKENMWKMDVKPEYVHMVNKLATGTSEFSKSEQETLAVIAYKQPVKQSVIINIRGNKSYDHIKHFIEIGLVHAKKQGHTKELKLSDDFFDYFHLTKKEDGSTPILETNEETQENNQPENNTSKNNNVQKPTNSEESIEKKEESEESIQKPSEEE